MGTGPMSLLELQREMAAVVMTPLTVDEGMRELTSDGRSTQAIAERIIAPNSRLSSVERLELYNRQYWFRVLDSLAEDFSTLRAVIGSKRYDAMAIAYISAHPNRSFTMRNLGSRLPEWLAENAEFAGRRHKLAVDVAKIEWAFVEAFDSAALTPLSADEVAGLGGESRLRLQPHLQLLALSYPADTLVLNRQQREGRQASEAGKAETSEEFAPMKLDSMRAQPTWLAVHRVEYNVYFRRLQKEEFGILSALASGLSLAEAMETGLSGTRISQKKLAEVLREWFALWAELGWLCARN
jgi:hypothetical protein